MFTVKLNKSLLLLWLAACGFLIASITIKENTFWNNVIFLIFIFLLAAAVWRHYTLKSVQSKPEQSNLEKQPLQVVAPQPAAQENTVILILGPYAAKWFSNPGATDNTRFSDHATWILISDPEALQKRLKFIADHHSSAQILVFFPFLPDVYDNASIIISQLTKWQRSFATLPLQTPLNSVFAIYLQLSGERLSHNPDNAYWTGNINLANQEEVDITSSFQALSHKFALQDNNSTEFAFQRNVMAHQLFAWLNESGITHTLQTLFSHTSLQLTDVILSDNGKGFIKHGAWSVWLERTLGILPGLASAVSLPPFPKVINWQTKPAMPTIEPEKIAPPTQVKWVWSLGFAAMLLAVHMAHTVSQQKVFYQQYSQQLAPLDNINELSIQQLAENLAALTNKGKALSTCISSFDITHWGLSQCAPLLKRVNHKIETYTNVPKFSSARMAPLFDSNSSKLKPNKQTNDILKSLLYLLEKNPDTKVLIIGHSDNTGSPSFNMKLSEQRAQVVGDWLIKNSSIPVNNLIVRGKGALEPIASNNTKIGQDQNRRVEVLLLPTQDKNVGV
ncbi:ompA family protein [Yersinia rohdei]|uniref:OmpA family protein n=1 Tax=Yersinia rohdei TaxID=29485 RepID=A0ABM5S9W2_YERRO|nr:OmpA family protein [Yersinia rohdei]AJJ09967.1 ompA family protein [Yersinia rohdei]EEQ03940.1 OmpA domain protein [Yersinia rohdei ATCC 43380]